MKKITSRYYFFIAILLVIAYQYLSGLILHSDFALGLSDFGYYLSDMTLHFLVILITLIFMVQSRKWQEINSKKFRWSYLFYCVLAFFCCSFGIELPFLFFHLLEMQFLINITLQLLQALRHF